MARIGELDLPDRLTPALPRAVTQIGFALLCTGAATMVRVVVDGIAPAAGPFALGYPAVLIATLFARWQAGVITAVITIVYSWYFVLPEFGSFQFANNVDGPRVIVNMIAYSVTIAIAELFRRAVRVASAERDAEVAERDLFLQEFDHRVKNNFALVASLLDMQRRRAKDEGTAQALSGALNRVESIARAHRHLYRGDGGATGGIDMATYLRELCGALSEALFLRGAITLDCNAEQGVMPRDRAVSVGLIVNELVTNAAKHAFAGREAGEISVTFAANDGGWRLTVADNGAGMPPETLNKGREGGLGQRLINAFVKQANGSFSAESGPQGTVVTVDLEG